MIKQEAFTIDPWRLHETELSLDTMAQIGRAHV